MKLLLRHKLCPGDVLVMTAALECLHQQHAGKYVTDVDTSCNAIFENNPHITKLEAWNDPEVKVIDLHYNLIQRACEQPCHFLQGYTECLATVLGIKLECTVNRPYLYLSDDEKAWINQVEESTGYKGSFWLVNAGFKNDYTIKKWTYDNWQEVVDRLKGKVTFVQVGENNHNHKPLRNVINLIGKTDTRQLIRLCYHAAGAITPESFLHHLMAAFGKPCITLCSGFLPISWIRYNSGTILTHQEKMCCFENGKACGKSRVTKLSDNDHKNNSLCTLPVLGEDPVARCMAMISPEQVVNAINFYYLGGRLRY